MGSSRSRTEGKGTWSGGQEGSSPRASSETLHPRPLHTLRTHATSEVNTPPGSFNGIAKSLFDSSFISLNLVRLTLARIRLHLSLGLDLVLSLGVLGATAPTLTETEHRAGQGRAGQGSAAPRISRHTTGRQTHSLRIAVSLGRTASPVTGRMSASDAAADAAFEASIIVADEIEVVGDGTPTSEPDVDLDFDVDLLEPAGPGSPQQEQHQQSHDHQGQGIGLVPNVQQDEQRDATAVNDFGQGDGTGNENGNGNGIGHESGRKKSRSSRGSHGSDANDSDPHGNHANGGTLTFSFTCARALKHSR